MDEREQPERVSADGKRVVPDDQIGVMGANGDVVMQVADEPATSGYCQFCGGEGGQHRIGCKA